MTEAKIIPLRPDASSIEDIWRPVYCVLGLPIDAVDMSCVLRRIDGAVANGAPFLMSTPNLDFLIQSRSDPEFRETLLSSDLCPPDGMPIIWIAKLIGLAVTEKVSGSDIFEALKGRRLVPHPLRVFFYGGEEGAAEAAEKSLNSRPSGLMCVGTSNPGFVSVEEMSTKKIIDNINASKADFLIAALGAKKGQSWLHRNHDALAVPVRAHLGAVINFEAGTINRAPSWLSACGLEWLWRIKEEPRLWRRYFFGAIELLRLVFTRVLPLAIRTRWQRVAFRRSPAALEIESECRGSSGIVKIGGPAIEPNVGAAMKNFQALVLSGIRVVTLDLMDVSAIDGRFLGLLLMLRKCLVHQGGQLRISAVSPPVRRMFNLHEVGFLLN